MNNKRKYNVGVILFTLLFLWYLIIFINIPGLTIDGKIPFFSLLTLLEFFLIIIAIGYILKWKYTDYAFLFILVLWGYLQFMGNWRYMFVKPPIEKLESYYQYFDGTLRILNISDTYIIPDAYHLILGILILLNIVFVLSKIVSGIIIKK